MVEIIIFDIRINHNHRKKIMKKKVVIIIKNIYIKHS